MYLELIGRREIKSAISVFDHDIITVDKTRHSLHLTRQMSLCVTFIVDHVIGATPGD